MDGPVITEARAALEAGDVRPLLKWVPAEGEAEINHVFAEVRRVRGLDPAAREIADRHLFATLVKVNRAPEGADYTGIKPAGHIDRGIMAADAALDNGRVDNWLRRSRGRWSRASASGTPPPATAAPAPVTLSPTAAARWPTTCGTYITSKACTVPLVPGALTPATEATAARARRPGPRRAIYSDASWPAAVA